MHRIPCLLLALCACSLLGAGEEPLHTPAVTMTYPDLVRRLTDLEHLAVLPTAGERGELASSYERKSRYDAATDRYIEWDANGDGYGGDGAGVIRLEGDRAVLADIQGPGCVWRLWSADPLKGRLSIYLDGMETPAVELPAADFFNGGSEPFTRPQLVYLPRAKGANNYTPIPFQKSCKIDWTWKSPGSITP